MKTTPHITDITAPWLTDTALIPEYPVLEQDITADVIVAGGGIAGISAAYYLAKQGLSVAVLEARCIGLGASGHNTAHITAHHGAVFAKYCKMYGRHKAALIFDAAKTSLTDIKDIISEENIACDYTPMPAYLTSCTANGGTRLKREAEAIRAIGGECELTLPRSDTARSHTKLTLTDSMSATLHPFKYLHGLAAAATNLKVRIFEHTKVTVVEQNANSCTVLANGRTATAKHLIIATHMPFVNFPGFYFMRTVSQRAYAAYYPDYKLSDNATEYNIDNNGLTYRPYQNGAIVCGEDHRTGTGSSKAQRFAALNRLANNSTPPRYAWSAQDVTTSDLLPLVGKYAKSMPNCLVITGFNKWGLNTAHISARIVTDIITGTPNPMIDVLAPSRRKPLSCKLKTIGANIMTVVYYIQGMFRRKSPICTHLKCRLKYNPDLDTWDCPCHGSVFTQKGEVIETPALRNIKD